MYLAHKLPANSPPRRRHYNEELAACSLPRASSLPTFFFPMRCNYFLPSLVVGALLSLCGSGGWNAVNGAEAASPKLTPEITTYLQKYCVDCHGETDPNAGLSLHKFGDELSVLKGKKAWDNVLVMVEGGEMPPEDATRPKVEETVAFLKDVRGIFERSAKSGKIDPGHVTIRRLNRYEYNNTIRDLVGVDSRPADDFPSDDVGHGFDNIGDVLTLSDVLMERYLAAAENVMERAIVINPPAPTQRSQSAKYLEPAGRNVPENGSHRPVNAEKKDSPIESGPLHTPYKLSDAGDYEFKMQGFREGDEPVKVAVLLHQKGLSNPASEEESSQLTGAALNSLKPFRILGTFDLFKRDDRDRRTHALKAELPAGDIRLAVALFKAEDGKPAPVANITNFQLNGPSDTRPASQRMLLECDPNLPREQQTRQVITRFASRAYRRTATPDEVNRLIGLVDQQVAAGKSWEQGVQYAMTAVLISPKFLFRLELDEKSSPKEAHPLNEFQLASRLSYFLWSSMPDQELFQLANRGELAKNLEPQVRRMLKDDKAKELVENFALQWLQLGRLKLATPDDKQFPEFTEQLRQAMLDETRLFLQEIIREDRSLLDLVAADFTYVNEPLARLYNIGDQNGNPRQGRGEIRGSEFVRVSLKDELRGGLLTQASFLTVTSNPTRTSPVKRGRWVLEQILGAPPPPPPANVPTLEDEGRKLTGTLRERMQQHRENPACANCHLKMDAIGFAFENYDAIGTFRTRDGEGEIDPAGSFPGGESFSGPAELKKLLKTKKTEIARCVTEKMLTFALGRGLEYYDTPAVDKIVARLEKEDYRFSALVLGIVDSAPFRLRRGGE